MLAQKLYNSPGFYWSVYDVRCIFREYVLPLRRMTSCFTIRGPKCTRLQHAYRIDLVQASNSRQLIPLFIS